MSIVYVVIDLWWLDSGGDGKKLVVDYFSHPLKGGLLCYRGSGGRWLFIYFQQTTSSDTNAARKATTRKSAAV